MGFVSCLCVTEAPLAGTKRAVRSFCAQTLEERELVLGMCGPARRQAAIARFVESLGRSDIRLVDGGGGIRALAGAARGMFACAWLAEDSSHPERLSTQCSALAEGAAEACLLGDWIVCASEQRTLYWCTLAGGEGRTEAYGGLLAAREAFGACLDALHGGTWPPHGRASVDLAGAGPLLVRTPDRGASTPDGDRLVAATFACERRDMLASMLPEHHLPRPALLEVRGTDGTPVVFDPFEA
jgi:hypothetical protein